MINFLILTTHLAWNWNKTKSTIRKFKRQVPNWEGKKWHVTEKGLLVFRSVSKWHIP